MTSQDWPRPIDHAETAHACLDSISQLVASCDNLHSVTTNEFSQLLGLVASQLRGSLDAMREGVRRDAPKPSDAMTAGRA
jgi:hypothetical protein